MDGWEGKRWLIKLIRYELRPRHGTERRATIESRSFFACVPVTDEGRIPAFACGKLTRGDGRTDRGTKTESVLLVD
jgi:hypothetical protein